MLLTFDIGNTNIKVAIFNHETIIEQWRIGTETNRTGDEYFAILHALFKNAQIDVQKIDNAVISSVVPQLIGAFIIVTQRFIHKKPIIVGSDILDKLPVTVPSTGVHQIGADLLCDAVQTWETFKGASIVVDFGTALSFIALNNKGEIMGIAIAPGIGTALKSLFTNTAQLPSVPLEIPKSSLGTNTIECIQSGILFGYKGLVENVINQMKTDMQKQLNIDKANIKTIATGGLNSILTPITKIFDKIDKELTLKGLFSIAQYTLREL